MQQLEDRAARAYLPLHVLVELTHACNLSCEHCYLDQAPSTDELTTSEWRRVFRELADEGCLFLILSGGEPLARPDWLALATHARGLGFALRIFTNGTLVTATVADQIASLRPLEIEVSLLGAIAATHDAITRRPGAFARTVAGVRALRRRGVPVLLKAMVMTRNAAELGAIRTLAAALDCSVCFDIEITPKNDGDPGPTRLAATGTPAVEAARAELLAGPGGLHAAREEDRAALLACAPCRAGRSTCHVGANGDVLPCMQWTRPVGNLRRARFRDLWRGSSDLGRLRSTRLADLPGCAGCQLLDVCSPCLALSLLENGNLEGPSTTRCRATAVRARALGVAGAPAATCGAQANSEPVAPSATGERHEREASL